MKKNNFSRNAVFMFLSILFFVTSTNYAQDNVIKIWNGLAPGTENRTNNEKVNGGNIVDVYQPDLTIFLPTKTNEKAPAVLVLPGGGYRQIVINKEGYAIAKWLNDNGIAAFVLKYRLNQAEALQDAQRALSFLRSKSEDYKIDKNKIGVIGFSAGGHLAANLSTHFQKEIMADHIDLVDCKPNFMILVYGYLNPFLSDVNEDTPPTFLVHAGDDPRVTVMESVNFYSALKKNNVPAELHVYEKGEHGFALREIDKPINNWAKGCIDWIGVREILDVK